MRIRLAGLVLGAFGTFVAACVVAPQTYGVDTFCTDKAQAMCQVSGACGFDANVCQLYQYKQCTAEAVQATNPDRRLYNSDNAHFCISAVQAAYGYGATSISSSRLVALHDTCERVYVGLGNAGDSCLLDYDCSAGLFCAPKTPGSNPAICEPVQAVNAGGSCDSPGAQCAADTYCAKQTNGSWACTDCPGAGQSCGAPGAFCMSTEHCVQQVCQPRGKKGDPCVNDNDCAADSPYCDSYSNTCASGLAFQHGNADCLGVAGLMSPPDPPDGGMSQTSGGEAGS
jgi:hypothetical protein